jgi:hypothetical protein
MGKPRDTTHPNAQAFPAGVSGPALRALAAAGIRSVDDLQKWTEPHGRWPPPKLAQPMGHEYRSIAPAHEITIWK